MHKPPGCCGLPIQERPDLANLKSALVMSNAKMKAELAALESKILGLLSASSGNMLDDEELINTLAQAKVRSALEPNHIAVKAATGDTVPGLISAAVVALMCCLCMLPAGRSPLMKCQLGWLKQRLQSVKSMTHENNIVQLPVALAFCSLQLASWRHLTPCTSTAWAGSWHSL